MSASVGQANMAEVSVVSEKHPFLNIPMVMHSGKNIEANTVREVFKNFAFEFVRVLSLTKSKILFQGEPQYFRSESISTVLKSLQTLVEEQNMLKINQELLSKVSQLPPSERPLVLEREINAVRESQAKVAQAQQALATAQQSSKIQVFLTKLGES